MLSKEGIYDYEELIHNDIILSIPSEATIDKEYNTLLKRCPPDILSRPNKKLYAFVSVNIIGIGAFSSYSPKVQLDKPDKYIKFKNNVRQISTIRRCF